MTVIVTGVSGFVGSCVAAAFVAKGIEVIGISRSKPKVEGIEWVQADLTKPVSPLLPYSVRTATVVHCAAEASDGKLSPKFYAANVQGTYNALNINPEGKFIHISSSSIYDLSHSSAFTEEEEFKVNGYKFYNGYGYTKALAEAVVLTTPRVIPSVTLRPHAIYGVGDTTLFPKLLQRVKNQALVLPNGGNVLHSLTHVSNVVQAVEKSLNFEAKQNTAFNITDAAPVALNEALKKVLPELKTIRNIPSGLLVKAGKLGLVSEYEIRQVGFNRTYSINKAKALLSYTPTRFVEDFK